MLNRRLLVRSSPVVLVAGLTLLGVGCGTTSSPPDLASGTDFAVALLPDLAPLDAATDGSLEDGGPAAVDLGADLTGPPPCSGTPKSCGAPGACLDCSNSTVGTACVASACGCMSASDCPVGSACDAKSHQCGTSCAGGLACNGGCCDGMKCQDGSANLACGSDGKACAKCGAGTPTCAAFACTANCVSGGGGMAGTCGNGFCCNAQNQCIAVGNGACGAAGAACVDCSMSGGGPVCLVNGACGCNNSADCPAGQACKAGACGTACDANATCNGGCCSAGKCGDGTQAAACALGQAMCGSCVGNPIGAACVQINGKLACGCTSASDCPQNSACDPVSKHCSSKCDANTPCNGGCCSGAMNGTCWQGTDVNACGSKGGVCTACSVNTGGKVCSVVQGGGQCGCQTLADCPAAAVACAGGLCDTKCSPQKPCQGGCCSNGTCVPGTANNACASSGVCIDCSQNMGGTACRVNLQCGCDKTTDCPTGLACNVVAHGCEAKCSAQQPCNGGCCSNLAGGTCLAGTAGNACGGQLGCVDCGNNKIGHACVNSGCGCNNGADCGALQACDPVKHVCTNACGMNQLCNGGCCVNGSCVDGTGNSACGNNGDTCAQCANGQPTCIAGTCGPRCGGVNDGVCGGGNCCSGGKCIPGNAQKTCGYGGACLDCSKLSVGTACIAPMNSKNWGCGCAAKTDCLAANPGAGIPGYACDTSNATCTSLCGIMGVTGCNGGCCSGPNGQCRSGGLDTACGLSGGFCTNCSSNCNPGPSCDSASGNCGCSVPSGQCNAFTGCFAGGINRFGCDLTIKACCVPGIYNFKDNGNPAGCCTGQSVNGVCTCALNGQMASGQWSCCSLSIDGGGNCKCLPTGGNANFGIGAEPRACCSNRVSGNTCVCSSKGQTCQSNDGCCGGNCSNGVCAS